MRRLALLAGLIALPAHAADPDQAHRVIVMVYDIGLYETELNRIMDEADTRGIYGGPGSTAAARARDKAATRTTMLAQRNAVLSNATLRLAARATDEQLRAILQMAATNTTPTDHSQLDAAVVGTKASFEAAMWDQLARTARGNATALCTKTSRDRC